MRCQHHSMTSPDQSKTIIRVIISLSNVKINFYRYLPQQRYFFRVYMTLFNNLKSKSCWIDPMFFKKCYMCNKFCFNHEYLKKKIYHNPEFMLWCYPSKVNLNSTVDHISSVRNTISHRGRWALGINFSDFPVVAPLCIMLQQANNIQKQTKWKKNNPKQAQLRS